LAERQHAVKSADHPLERTPAGNAFSDLVVQVLRLHGLLIAAGNAMAKPAGQTEARWQVLGVAEHGPATVADIARIFGLARQSVQRTADALQRDGLIEFEENPRHRRARLVRITHRGEAVLREIQAAQQVWADALGAQIGERDLRAAEEVLGRVRKALGPPGPARAR
jgi:DNA-binding MarR family transcriptional regulator